MKRLMKACFGKAKVGHEFNTDCQFDSAVENSHATAAVELWLAVRERSGGSKDTQADVSAVKINPSGDLQN